MLRLEEIRGIVLSGEVLRNAEELDDEILRSTVECGGVRWIKLFDEQGRRCPEDEKDLSAEKTDH